MAAYCTLLALSNTILPVQLVNRILSQNMPDHSCTKRATATYVRKDICNVDDYCCLRRAPKCIFTFLKDTRVHALARIPTQYIEVLRLLNSSEFVPRLPLDQLWAGSIMHAKLAVS